jgi:hypothetical protein
VVPKSGGAASGRRLLQEVEGEAVVYVNRTSVMLEVRALTRLSGRAQCARICNARDNMLNPHSLHR